MAFAGGLGMTLNLQAVARDEVAEDAVVLFSESQSRFLLEVRPADAAAIEARLTGLPYAAIGMVTQEQRFLVTGLRGDLVLTSTLAELLAAWQATKVV